MILHWKATDGMDFLCSVRFLTRGTFKNSRCFEIIRSTRKQIEILCFGTHSDIAALEAQARSIFRTISGQLFLCSKHLYTILNHATIVHQFQSICRWFMRSRTNACVAAAHLKFIQMTVDALAERVWIITGLPRCPYAANGTHWVGELHLGITLQSHPFIYSPDREMHTHEFCNAWERDASSVCACTWI